MCCAITWGSIRIFSTRTANGAARACHRSRALARSASWASARWAAPRAKRWRIWASRDKALPNIACHTGADGLDTVLATSDILVLLLPQTPATRHILNARSIARLPKGAVILNPGRGPLIDDDALIAALRAGHVGHATLDVFATEPLPPEHPYWAMPNVTVTPHIASATRPETAAPVVVENILRCEAGKPLLHRVDREQGY